ncbi:MAG: F0F1 ATP synthase subunit delta [Gammaproteobacteria bacterium HGW-Gammaproteobacteria-3]|nr:MAG: F0F1 ATP synthase subunit delta [Gammaproteobacteria bacterium HGW-Gammaproteobacteria-3]
MSELATLARPYAEAVFKRAKETGSSAKWSEALAFISSLVNDEIIKAATDNPKIKKNDLTNLLLDICNDQVDQEAKNFLQVLVQNKRLKVARHIVVIFEQFRAQDEGYTDVDVASAYALSKDETKNLTATLENTLKKKVRLKVQVERSLIGGIVVRAGDTVIDGSIKGQLQHMQKALQ